MFASSPVKAWLRRWRYFVVEARSNLINGRVRVAVDFLAWVRRRRESISAAICDRGATQPKSISDAIRRTRALCGVWQRCSLLTDPCRYAHRSFLASHHKLLLRGLLLFMRWLLSATDASSSSANKPLSVLPWLNQHDKNRGKL